MKINLSQIKPSPRPVRTVKNKRALNELAQSITEQGLVQPIKVRPLDLGDYEIVFGHRRYEATRLAGLSEIECLVESMTDDEAYWQALIENMVRRDLTPIEEGEAFLFRKETEGLSGSEIGRRLGVSEDYINTRIRLCQDESASIWNAVDQRQTGDVVMKADAIRRATENESLRKSLTQKVIDETISHPHLRQIARAVKVAETIEREDERAAVIEELIETPYDPRIHNERQVQTRKEFPRPDRKNVNAFQWALQPDAKKVLDFLQDFESKLDRRRDGWYRSVESGKFSEEATRFIAQRMRRIVNTLETIAKGYEDYDHD